MTENVVVIDIIPNPVQDFPQHIKPCDGVCIQIDMWHVLHEHDALVGKGGSVLGWGVAQGTARTWCCRVHFLRTIHPHPLTLSPYVQMLARGLAGALGWIRRPHRGRESRGGHGRGWPATQLPAQVSTGPHEHLLLPLLLIPSMLMAALPNSNPAVIELVNLITY